MLKNTCQYLYTTLAFQKGCLLTNDIAVSSVLRPDWTMLFASSAQGIRPLNLAAVKPCVTLAICFRASWQALRILKINKPSIIQHTQDKKVSLRRLLHHNVLYIHHSLHVRHWIKPGIRTKRVCFSSMLICLVLLNIFCVSQFSLLKMNYVFSSLKFIKHSLNKADSTVACTLYIGANWNTCIWTFFIFQSDCTFQFRVTTALYIQIHVIPLFLLTEIIASL